MRKSYARDVFVVLRTENRLLITFHNDLCRRQTALLQSRGGLHPLSSQLPACLAGPAGQGMRFATRSRHCRHRFRHRSAQQTVSRPWESRLWHRTQRRNARGRRGIPACLPEFHKRQRLRRRNHASPCFCRLRHRWPSVSLVQRHGRGAGIPPRSQTGRLGHCHLAGSPHGRDSVCPGIRRVSWNVSASTTKR